MKKLLLTVALVAGVTSMSFGQGKVNFFNSPSTLITTNTDQGGLPTGSLAPVAGLYNFALMIAPGGTTALGSFSNSGLVGANQASAGRFTGGAGVALPNDANYAIGANVAMYVVGWSANWGSSYAQALASYNAALSLAPTATAGFWGQSAIANVVVGGGTTPVGNIFGVQPGQIGGFNLGFVPVVPEPTTLALAGLGAASLLLFRRRK